jgi:PAS domain S-box-containing protein
MNDGNKTKKQLLEELRTLRQHIAELDEQSVRHTFLKTKLREDQDIATAILDIIGALVVVLDTKGCIVLFNQACQRLTGYTANEVKGLPLWDVLLPAEEVPTVKAVFQSLCAGTFPSAYRNYCLDKDGNRYLITWSNTVLLNPQGEVAYVIGTGIDITKLHQTQEALREREATTSAILETAVDGIITIDESGTIESFNPAAERLLGYSAAEAIGQNVSLLMPKQFLDAAETYINRYLTTGQPQIIGRGREVNARRKDGTTLPVMLAVSETLLKNRRLFTGVLHDLTGLKQAEQEIRKADRLALVGQLASGLAHEIGTPLNVIAGNAELLRSDLKAQGLDAIELDTIITQADRITNFIERLLTFARAKEHEVEAIALDEPLSRALHLLEPRFRREEISVILEVPGDLPLIQCSNDQLEQVFLNVLVNAWHAMPNGGRVTIGARFKEPQRLEVTFADTGIGMTSTELSRAFEPFYSTKGERGTGLGLAICRQIIDNHGGAIYLASQKGDGTTVFIELPCDDVSR